MGSADKESIRAGMLEVRRGLGDLAARSERVRVGLERLLGSVDPRVVVAYDARRGEPDLGPWVARLDRQGVVVRVPGVTRDAPPPVVVDADVIVVPGVAFTRQGDRLGRGAGWYDRVLTAVPVGALVIGVCFEEQLVDELPVDVHDVPMHVVVTDGGSYRRTTVAQRPRGGGA